MTANTTTRTPDHSTARDHDHMMFGARIGAELQSALEDTWRNPCRWKRFSQMLDRAARFAGAPARFAR